MDVFQHHRSQDPGTAQHHHHRCKAARKLSLASASPQPPYSAAVARRNERERKRVHLVNMGFASLRSHLPDWPVASKKLSKVETLRSAVEYITKLQQLLGEAARENLRPPSSLTDMSPAPSDMSPGPSPDSSVTGRCAGCAGGEGPDGRSVSPLSIVDELERSSDAGGDENNHFLELAHWFGYAS